MATQEREGEKRKGKSLEPIEKVNARGTGGEAIQHLVGARAKRNRSKGVYRLWGHSSSRDESKIKRG